MSQKSSTFAPDFRKSPQKTSEKLVASTKERWQSGRLRRSWKPLSWEAPGVRIPLSPQHKMKNESDRARFLYVGIWTSTCWMEICIDTKKSDCNAISSFWVAQDARGRLWVFEVAERSEVGALESLSANLSPLHLTQPYSILLHLYSTPKKCSFSKKCLRMCIFCCTSDICQCE